MDTILLLVGEISLLPAASKEDKTFLPVSSTLDRPLVCWVVWYATSRAVEDSRLIPGGGAVPDRWLERVLRMGLERVLRLGRVLRAGLEPSLLQAVGAGALMPCDRLRKRLAQRYHDSLQRKHSVTMTASKGSTALP